VLNLARLNDTTLHRDPRHEVRAARAAGVCKHELPSARLNVSLPPLILLYNFVRIAVGWDPGSEQIFGLGKFEMTPNTEAVIEQFHASLGKVSSAERQVIQREVTNLFLADVAILSERQVAIFNRLMSHLIERTDRTGLLELSARLAAIDKAPADVVVRLSSDNDIGVAGPVLEKSNVLTDDHLIAIARAKSQGHLLAIAGRAWINEPVTDVLVERGNKEVARKVVTNFGARFSEIGFVKMITEAGSDKTLAAALAGRTDIPTELQPFLQLACA
jgi:uncharacterized protein (DUF2336 family)